MSPTFAGMSCCWRLSRSTIAAVSFSSSRSNSALSQRRTSPPRTNAEKTEYDDVRASAASWRARWPSDEVESGVAEGLCTLSPRARSAPWTSGKVSGSARQSEGSASSSLTDANNAAIFAASLDAVPETTICERMSSGADDTSGTSSVTGRPDPSKTRFITGIESRTQATTAASTPGNSTGFASASLSTAIRSRLPRRASAAR